MSLHDNIVGLVFADNADNKEVGRFLVKLGWIYTFAVSVASIWMKAAYGKHMEEGILSSK